MRVQTFYRIEILHAGDAHIAQIAGPIHAGIHTSLSSKHNDHSIRRNNTWHSPFLFLDVLAMFGSKILPTLVGVRAMRRLHLCDIVRVGT